MGLSGSLDTLGVLARDVADLALARAVLLGTDEPRRTDQTSGDPPRISLMRGPHWWDGEIEMRNICLRAIDALAAAGAETGEVAHPDIFAELSEAQRIVMGYEAARVRKFEFTRHKTDLSAQFVALIEEGRRVDDAAYAAALAKRDRARAMLELMFARPMPFLLHRHRAKRRQVSMPQEILSIAVCGTSCRSRLSHYRLAKGQTACRWAYSCWALQERCASIGGRGVGTKSSRRRTLTFHLSCGASDQHTREPIIPTATAP